MRKRNWVLLAIVIIFLITIITVIHLTVTNQTLAYIKDDARQISLFEEIYPAIFEAESLQDSIISKDVTVYQNIIDHTSFVQSHKEKLDTTISTYSLSESDVTNVQTFTVSTSFDIDKRLLFVRLTDSNDELTFKEYVYKLSKGKQNKIKYKLKNVYAAGH